MLQPQTKSRKNQTSKSSKQNPQTERQNDITQKESDIKIIQTKPTNRGWKSYKEREYIKIRRVAFDANFHMFRLDFAVEKLCGDIGRESDVDVHLL